jgi:hypothetical protein
VASILVSTELAATPHEVWDDLQDIASHVEWMADAEAIRFTSERRSGVGTTFDCETKIGPIRLNDRMAITAWDAPAADGRAAMGVRHEGLVTGAGAFRLDPIGEGRTRFTWEEDLTFPWWLAGPVGGVFGKPVLRAVWRRNLTNLQQRFL